MQSCLLACGYCDATPVPGDEPAAVLKALETSILACDEPDTFVCFFSGHGAIHRGDLYLVLNASHANNFLGTALPIATVKQWLDECRARNRLLILDCCHAGAASGWKDAAAAVYPSAALAPKNHVMLLASERLERARELDSLGGSFLTHHVCAFLRQRGPGTGRATLDQLMTHLERAAQEQNESVRSGRAAAERTASDESVPIPYLAGEKRGEFVLRADPRSSKVEVFYEAAGGFDRARVERTLSYYDWDALAIARALPIEVSCGEAIASAIATIKDVGEAFDKLTEAAANTESEIANGVRALAAAYRANKREGTEWIRHCGAAIDLYASAKACALVRVILGVYLGRGLEAPEWMHEYFALSAVTSPDLLCGLTLMAQRSHPETTFWVDAVLTIDDLALDVFVPSVAVGVAADDQLDALRRFAVPQLADDGVSHDVIASLLGPQPRWTLHVRGRRVWDGQRAEQAGTFEQGYEVLRTVARRLAERPPDAVGLARLEEQFPRFADMMTKYRLRGAGIDPSPIPPRPVKIDVSPRLPRSLSARALHEPQVHAAEPEPWRLWLRRLPGPAAVAVAAIGTWMFDLPGDVASAAAGGDPVTTLGGATGLAVVMVTLLAVVSRRAANANVGVEAVRLAFGVAVAVAGVESWSLLQAQFCGAMSRLPAIRREAYEFGLASGSLWVGSWVAGWFAGWVVRASE